MIITFLVRSVIKHFQINTQMAEELKETNMPKDLKENLHDLLTPEEIQSIGEEAIKKANKEQAKMFEETKEWEEKIKNILYDNINYYVMLRDLDSQYQRVFDELIGVATHEICILLLKKDEEMREVVKDMIGKEKYTKRRLNKFREDVCFGHYAGYKEKRQEIIKIAKKHNLIK